MQQHIPGEQPKPAEERERKEPGTTRLLPSKRGGQDQDQPRFANEEEFEAFWDRLELEAQAKQGITEQSQIEKTICNQIDKQEPSSIPGEAEKMGIFRQDEQVPDTGEAQKRLLNVVENRPLARELMRRTLELCLERQPYTDVEHAIEDFPEYACAAMTPYQIISTLLLADGLRKIELDANGDEVSPEQKTGLSEDDADDLVESFALETTSIGRTAVDELAPLRRLGNLFSELTDRCGIFSDVMDFCREVPRSYQEIEALLSDRDLSGIASLNPTSHASIQPSVFIDSLERAGGLVWRNGWKLTQEGEAIFSSFAH